MLLCLVLNMTYVTLPWYKGGPQITSGGLTSGYSYVVTDECHTLIDLWYDGRGCCMSTPLLRQSKKMLKLKTTDVKNTTLMSFPHIHTRWW